MKYEELTEEQKEWVHMVFVAPADQTWDGFSEKKQQENLSRFEKRFWALTDEQRLEAEDEYDEYRARRAFDACYSIEEWWETLDDHERQMILDPESCDE